MLGRAVRALSRLGYEVCRAGYVSEPTPHNQSLYRAGSAYPLAHNHRELSALGFGSGRIRGILPRSSLIPGLREKLSMTANTKYLSMVLICHVTTAAIATDRLVPHQYPSIQAAINASATGDRVLLAAGTYREAVSLLGKSVTIEGAAGQRPTDTVLVSPGGPAVVFSDSVSYSGVIGLRNLTIDGESVTKSGAGVVSSYLGPDASLIFERCVFRNWHSAQTDGGAMFIAHPRTVVRQCAFSGNWSSVHGAAVYAYDGVQAIIEHCCFDGHTFGTGTFYARTNASLDVRECVVRNSNALTAHWQTGKVS